METHLYKGNILIIIISNQRIIHMKQKDSVPMLGNMDK
jgi:hypothetical protein